MTPQRTLSITSAVVLLAASTAVLLVRPGGAAEPGLTYTAAVTGEVLRIHELDPDFSGAAAAVDLAAGRAEGSADVGREPRAEAGAANLHGSHATAPVAATSAATSTTDTSAPTMASAPAGAVTGMLEHGAATLTSRSRWSGDATCTPAGTPLTTARTDMGTVRTAPTTLPLGLPGVGLPLPTDVPTEIPTELPTELPTLPTELPSTDLTTTGLPTDLPTDLPTSDLPTDLPTTILPAPSRVAAAPGDSVSLVEAAPVTMVATTALEPADLGRPEGLRARVTALPASTTTPVLTFFGGEVTVTTAGPSRLTSYSPGSGTSSVTSEPAAMVLHAGGQDVPIPETGALAVPSADNGDVVVTVSRGELDEVEDPTGRVAGGTVAALDIVIRNGDDLVLRASYLPMTVRTQAPDGGVLCPRDTDGDRLLDRDEVDVHGTDPERADTDGDRLKDGVEVTRFRTNPLRKDTDRDKLTDRVEIKKYKTNPRRKDTDRDKLTDRVEIKKYQTNPRRKDTDRDGVSDYREIKRGTDPRKP